MDAGEKVIRLIRLILLPLRGNIMTPAGAKSLARLLHDEQANPPVYAKVATNGDRHESVVHVTFGQPKPVEKTDNNGQLLKVVVPERPCPYTVS
jgi:hypothetical protein